MMQSAAARFTRAGKFSGVARGYRTSLDWVKAGCPPPPAPEATPTLIAPNAAAAAVTDAADVVLAPARRMVSAQGPIFAICGFAAAGMMVMNLNYLENEYADDGRKSEQDFEQVEGRYGGAFVNTSKKEPELVLDGPRYGGITEPGTLGLQKTRSQFIKEDDE